MRRRGDSCGRTGEQQLEGDGRKRAGVESPTTHRERPRSVAGQSVASLTERYSSLAVRQRLQCGHSQIQTEQVRDPSAASPTAGAARRWSFAAAGEADATGTNVAIDLPMPDYQRNGGGGRRQETAVGAATTLGDDSYHEQLREALLAAKESALLPLKEDVAGWLTKLLNIELNAENLMEQLQNGVLLCRLARLIDERLQPERASSVRFHNRASAGSFLARDNASAFLVWAREFGVDSELLFESNDLVLRRDPLRVVQSLLDVARKAVARGLVEEPALVAMERELSGDEQQPEAIGSVGEAKPAAKACHSETHRTSSSTSTKTQKNMSALDRKVAELAGTCQCCPNRFRAQKVSEGVYLLGDRQSLVRLLNDRHVMVRVGGGWDSLQHYLLCHDPCRIVHFRRSGAYAAVVDARSATSTIKQDEDRFLHLKGKYKSSSTSGLS